MKSSFYRGNIARLIKNCKQDSAKFWVALNKEQIKTAKSLEKFKTAELISIINDLNTEKQLADEIKKEQDEIIKKLDSMLKEHIGDYKGNGPAGGTLGKAFKLIREQSIICKELNAIATQHEIKAHKTESNLAGGRQKANIASKAKAQERGQQLMQAIRDYLKEHSAAKNGQIFRFLKDRGFVSEKGYTENTLEKKIAIIAAKCRKELSGQ